MVGVAVEPGVPQSVDTEIIYADQKAVGRWGP
jgi:hypothetical protein